MILCRCYSGNHFAVKVYHIIKFHILNLQNIIFWTSEHNYILIKMKNLIQENEETKDEDIFI